MKMPHLISSLAGLEATTSVIADDSATAKKQIGTPRERRRGWLRKERGASRSLSEDDGIIMPHPDDVLTESQQKLLEEFRERVRTPDVAEEELKTIYLCKWLIARNFDLDKSEKMFKKSQEWRKEVDISKLLSWSPPEVLVKYAPLGYPGFDKHGGAVVIIPHGKVDIRGLLLSCKKGDYVNYILKVMEEAKKMMKEESVRRNSEYCRVTCIFDMEGFSIKEFTWKPALEAIFDLLRVYEANYPEFLNCAYVVNAPKVFSIAMTLIKPFLNDHTINKIKIFGKSGWKEEVVKDIDSSVLPRHWGGERVEPDEMCTSFMCMGGRIPSSYYLKNRMSSHLKTLTVNKGTLEKIPIHIKEPDSLVKWEFESDDYDIAFGIQKAGTDMDPLVALKRVDSHLTPEEGQIVCPHPGNYEVIFDNTYSYYRSKVVHYSVDVNSPESNK